MGLGVASRDAGVLRFQLIDGFIQEISQRWKNMVIVPRWISG